MKTQTKQIEEWVKKHFGEDARISGYCSCGRTMGKKEYYYSGGSHGQYICSQCGQVWIHDLNGAMVPGVRQA